MTVLFAVGATENNQTKKNIIYEYKIITQKKGQALDATLKAAKLSPYQAQLILSIPVMREAKSDRVFRLAYIVENSQRLLREVRVTRDNRMANFVLIGAKGKHRFISQASKIPVKIKRTPAKRSTQKSTQKNTQPAVKTTSVAAKKSTQDITKETKKEAKSEKKRFNLSKADLFAVSFTQQKGETLNAAWRAVKLSKYQQQIIQNGKFIKSARSQRQFTLFFQKSGNKRLLRGLRIVRGKNRVEFVVEEKNKTHQLTNLKTLHSADKKQVLKHFSQAKVIKPAIKLVSTAVNSGKKVATTVKVPTQLPKQLANQVKTTIKNNSTRPSILSRGNYERVRFWQLKGQSIATAIKDLSLTQIQRELIQKLPVMKQAKSKRQFNLLFEKKGWKKYLRAANVIRNNKQAEFVLVNHKGKWTWANQKGEISVGTRFLRYPMNFTRISSHFNLRRRHPITRRIRPHKGTDFKAPHGRVIWSPADGVVTFAGRQRGYGITLVIDHGNGYKTKYAHLSRIKRGIRKGVRVKQKQHVARLGNTGISTGAHLHYEVIVNGRHRNPMTVPLPGGGSGKKLLPEAAKNAKKFMPRLRHLMK